MKKVFLVEAIRTPLGKFVRDYSDYSLKDLMTHIINHITWDFDRAILGCSLTAGSGLMPLNHALLCARKDPHKSGGMVSYGQATGIFALKQAYQCIKSGKSDVMLTIAAESLTHSPHLISGLRHGVEKGMCLVNDHIIHDLLTEYDTKKRLNDSLESFCRTKNIKREDLDQYVIEGYEHTLGHIEDISKCLVPLGSLEYDTIFDEVRPMTIQNNKPIFGAEGRLTDAHIAHWADGACGVVLSSHPSEIQVKSVVHHFSEDIANLFGEVIQKLCARIGWSEDTIDVVEVSDYNVCFPVHISHFLNIPYDRINPWGGSITYGWPMGTASLMHVVHLYHNLKNGGGDRGIAIIYAGCRHAMALALERVKHGTMN